MGKVIQLHPEVSIIDFFLNTPELHNAVTSTYTGEQEKEWYNNQPGAREVLLRADSVYFDKQNETAFLVENSKGVKLAFGYLKDSEWHYRILSDEEQSEFTEFLEQNTTKVPNIREVHQNRHEGLNMILEALSTEGFIEYQLTEDLQPEIWDDPDKTGEVDELIEMILKKHFETDGESDPFVLYNPQGDPVFLCAILPRFNSILYEILPQPARKAVRKLLDAGE